MFITGRGTLASCPCQEETRDKRVPVAAAGSGPLAGKLLPEYPKWSGCQSQQRRVPTRVTVGCRKRDHFQGPKVDSCLTLRNELSKETHGLTKQEMLLGRGTQVESSRVREPTLLTVLVFMVMGLVVFSHASDSKPFKWYTPSPAKMDASEKDSGRCSDIWCLLLTFPELFPLVEAY